jgi:HlyD family secretion protein
MMEQTGSDAKLSSPPLPGAGMDRAITPRHRPLWLRRGLLILVAVVLAGAALRWVIPASGSADIPVDTIATGPAELARFEDYLPVRAEVAPAVTTLVGVMSGGQVETLLVEDGALVAQGQPLARLANPELRLQVMTQEAQIASQLGGVASENLGIARSQADRKAQLSQAQFDLVEATREYDARRQLHERGFLSDAGIQRYVSEVEFQRDRVEELRRGLASESRFVAAQGAMLDQTRGRLQGTLTALRASLDALTIRAPRSGRLTNFTLQPGQTLAAGDPAGQIDSESEWKLVAEVDEFHLGRLRAGQTGQTVDGAKLVVAKVLPTVSSGRFRVELAFAGPVKARLNRGQTLDVRIQLGAATRALVVPMGGWLTEGASSVFVLDKDGAHARRRTIKIGRRNPRQVEILSGLKPGEIIITTNLAQVEGDLLNIR